MGVLVRGQNSIYKMTLCLTALRYTVRLGNVHSEPPEKQDGKIMASGGSLKRKKNIEKWELVLKRVERVKGGMMHGTP